MVLEKPPSWRDVLIEKPAACITRDHRQLDSPLCCRTRGCWDRVGVSLSAAPASLRVAVGLGRCRLLSGGLVGGTMSS